MTTVPQKYSRRNTIAAALSSALVLGAWFAVYLARSLWRDEGIIAWLSYANWHDCLVHTAAFQPWLPLYILLSWIAAHSLGFGDWQLRVLPVTAILASLPLIYKIARRCGGTAEAGFMTLLFFASSRLVAMHVAEARPYALVIFFSFAGLLCLLKFLDEDSPLPAAAWTLCWSCALYCHFLSGAAFAAQAAAALYLLKDNPAKRRIIIIATAAFAILSLPAFYLAVSPYGGMAARVYLNISKPWEMLVPLVPLEIALGAASGIIVAMLTEWKVNIFENSPSGFISTPAAKLLLVSWIAPVVLLYLFSISTPLHVFTHRYMLASMTAGAVFSALFLWHYTGERTRLLIIAGVLVTAGWRISLTQFYRPYENWRDAAAQATVLSDSHTVFFMESTLGESMDLRLAGNPAFYDYLSSIKAPYPLPKKPLLLPMVINAATRRFCAALVDANSTAQNIVFITGNGQDEPDLFAKLAAKHGFKMTIKKAYGSIWIARLER